MNPLAATRGRTGLYLLLWLPIGLLIVGALRFLEIYDLARGALVVLPLALAYAFVCPGAYYLCKARPLHLAQLPRLVGTHVGAAAVTASLWTFAGSLWSQALAAAGLLPPDDPAYLRATPVLFGAGLLLFLLSGALFYVLISYEDSRRSERRALELEVLSREAELKALRAQLHPHFLFNSLNSISALVTRDPEEARRLCVLLADFLRQSLTLGGRESIPLGQELDLAQKLLSIEAVRFGPRLRYHIEADEAARACQVPPLILQTLVENAVTHGIAHLLDGGELRLSAARLDDRLKIAIENPRDPDAPRSRGAGVGLENVRRRLEALYGSEARLTVHAETEAFGVGLSLPARRS